MNPTKHISWSCRVVRFGASLTRAGESAAWVQGHVEGCPSCQEHYAAAAALEQGLRTSALGRTAAPPASLEQDIMREIMASASSGGSAWGREVPSRLHRPRRVWPTFAVAASAACAVALVFVQRPHQATPSPSPRTPAQAVASASGSQTTTPWTQLAAPVRTLLNEDPLQSEAEQVYAEARSAVDFLALNFLPNPPGTETDASL